MGTLQFGCFIVLFLLVIILMCVSDLIRYTVLYRKFGDDWRTSFSKAWKDFIQFMLGYDNKKQD